MVLVQNNENNGSESTKTQANSGYPIPKAKQDMEMNRPGDFKREKLAPATQHYGVARNLFTVKKIVEN
jgi:hypothetical protein